MSRMLMSGVAVAALLMFTPLAGAQQAQQPSVETMPNQGGGTGPDTGAGGAAGTGDETQGGAAAGAGAANQMPEETQSGQDKQKSSDGMEKSSDTKKKSSETKKSSDSMQKQTGEGADKTKKQGQAEQDLSGATGSTGKAGKINIPEGKRSQVVKSFSSHKVKHADVDFDVSIGVAVPATVVLHPVPVDIIEIVPEFRRYRYFVLANGEIVIVDPATMVVIYVLAA
jgi:hypothetical protein